MPTETFARLPEEKRGRFLEAAWAEFTRAPFSETSVSRIVRQAGIPRGSFYQYFADKEELFAYLLLDVQRKIAQFYLALIRRQGGDLFRSQMAAFDAVRDPDGGMDPDADRCMRIMRINPGLDFQKIMSAQGGRWTEEICAALDTSAYRRRDPGFVRQVFVLSLMSLAGAIMDTLLHPERREACRRELEARLEIICHGCLDGGRS